MPPGSVTRASPAGAARLPAGTAGRQVRFFQYNRNRPKREGPLSGGRLGKNGLAISRGWDYNETNFFMVAAGPAVATVRGKERTKMDFFWEMLSLQETLFLLILLGVLIKKLKIVSEVGRKTLSDLLIYVVLPCNIVESFMGGIQLPEGFVRNCVLAVAISVGIQLTAVYGSKLLFRRYPAEKKSVLSYGMICSNSSFVGLPIAHLMFGDLGVIYTSMFQIPLRFTMWTAGLSLFTSVSRKDAFRKLVRHPCIIAVFVGLVLMVAPVSLPEFLDEAIAATSSCTVPISMLVIGSILADAPIRSMFSGPVLWYTCLRLALFPLLVWLVLKPFPLDPTLVNVCILMTGMPAGSTASILADKYDGDAVFASQITFASTLCSILTIPLLTMIMETVPA